MHIFPYSKRKGTPAAARQDQIPETVKKHRAEKLAELDKEMQQAYFAQNVGTNHAVLVEQPIITDKKATGYVEGLTENYIRVEFKGEPDLCGKMIDVKITEALIDNCKGIIV